MAMIKETLLQIIDRFLTPFKGLSVTQRATVFFILFLTVVGAVALLNWVLKPEYSMLISGVEPADMQMISEELNGAGIPYKIEEQGKRLVVPRDKLYEARLALAKQDLLYENSIGYELFDKKDIGVSEFVQQVNYRRALEGEISRTIQSMQEVNKARVHVVFPKDRLYRQDQEDPTSSIVLTLNRRAKLTDQQILGITHLVAKSVEGLEPENVSILDDHGNLLTNFTASNSLAGVSDTQLDVQGRVETYLEDKAQSMLQTVLGADNVIVRVRADLDFRQIEQTNENYDPDNPVVLSEETETSTSMDSAGVGETAVEHSLVNYQLTKSIERIIGDVGSINRLSIAVLVNDKIVEITSQEGDVTLEPQPRTQAEIDQISLLVQNSIGFNTNRGDQIDVQNITFEDMPDRLVEKEPFALDEWFPYVKRLIYIILIGIALFVLRKRFKMAQAHFEEIIEAQEQEQMEIADIKTNLEKEYQEKLDEQVKVNSFEELEKERLEKSITAFIEKNPGSAAKLVKSWMQED
jgi:flagellar M-ring protein FliF